MQITFEGIDGSGKTTQIEILKQHLRKSEVPFYHLEQPYMTPLGCCLREYLAEGYTTSYDPYVFALMFAANRAEMNKMTDLFSDRLIVSDRSLWSNLVYSNLDRKWFDAIEKYSPHPDLTILLDIDPQVAIERCEGTEAYETIKKLTDARQGYLELAGDPSNMFEVIKCEDKTKEEIFIEVAEILKDNGVEVW